MNFKNELTFYFNNNIGVSSNMFTALQGSSYIPLKLFNGQATYNHELKFNENTYKEIRKYNQINRKVQLLSTDNRRKLISLFDWSIKLPPELQIAFGKKAGLSLWYILDETKTDQENLLLLIKACQTKKTKPIITFIDNLYNQLETIWKSL